MAWIERYIKTSSNNIQVEKTSEKVIDINHFKISSIIKIWIRTSILLKEHDERESIDKAMDGGRKVNERREMSMMRYVFIYGVFIIIKGVFIRCNW